MATEKQYRATMRALDRNVGLTRVEAIHLNDSKVKFGARVDRHAKIGAGHMGLKPFEWLLKDRRFRTTPMYLETPKGREGGEELDLINLRTLRGLVRQRGPRRGRAPVG
jgi:deoxyribonuclease-4